MMILCLLLFMRTLHATPLDCIMRGKILPDYVRTQFLCMQKKMAHQIIPHVAKKAIESLKKNSQILNSLQSLTNTKTSITWEQLEQHNKPLILLGFGSLMHTKSHLNRYYQPNINIPCIAFGVKRMYSLLHPTPQTSCAGLPTV